MLVDGRIGIRKCTNNLRIRIQEVKKNCITFSAITFISELSRKSGEQVDGPVQYDEGVHLSHRKYNS
jgi:hypothetical protein